MRNENSRVNICISKKLHKLAKERSDFLFAGNFSSYIAHLIAKDLDNANSVKSSDTSPIITNNKGKTKTKIVKELQ